MQPIRRNKQFKLNVNVVNDWHQDGPGVTQFLNAMSLFFPAGERYFIRSVRALQNKTPASMKDQISAFIGQEAFHGREHDKLNAALNSPAFMSLLERALELLSDKLPKDYNLAATVALEHITAILAQGLLEDVEYFMKSDQQFCELWIWHALEETEHKAVAFDQYEAVVDKKVYAYVVRSVALVIASLIFMVAVTERYFTLLHRNDQLTVGNVVGTVKFLFFKPAILVRTIPRWLDWFKPSFHPWDHDNSYELSKYKELLAS